MNEKSNSGIFVISVFATFLICIGLYGYKLEIHDSRLFVKISDKPIKRYLSYSEGILHGKR
jgi:hypothetical protein